MESFSKGILRELDLEIVVVTIPSLDGEQINPYAVELFEYLGIGKKTQKGVLILLSEKESLARIEVSYELEHIFTDAFCSYVENFQMQPYFQVDRIKMAVSDSIHMMILRLQDYNEGKELEDYSAKMSDFEKEYRLWWSGGGGSKMVMDIGSGLKGKPILTEQQRKDFRPQDDPRHTLELYYRVLDEKLYDPTLDIYTEGTKMTLAYWPLADVVNKGYLDHLNKGRPWRVFKKGDFAVVKMKEGVVRGPDYFFVKTTEGWKFDYVSVLRTLRYYPSGVWKMYDYRTPYAFAYNKEDDYNRKHNDRDLVGEMKDIEKAIAKKNDWAYEIIDDDFEESPNVVLKSESGKSGINIVGSLGLKGIIVVVDPEVEPLAILFDRSGVLTDIMPQISWLQSNMQEIRFSACKTQFGTIDSHICIIDLLDILKGKYITDLVIEDEGSYWTSRDRKLLAEKRAVLAHYMRHTEKVISNIEISSDAVQSSDSVASHIEKALLDAERKSKPYH